MVLGNLNFFVIRIDIANERTAFFFVGAFLE
jgi:hypothetical protein